MFAAVARREGSWSTWAAICTGGVIQEKDILRCENAQVTYRWRDSKTKRAVTRTVSGVRFWALVLRHVLPKGFRRPSSKRCGLPPDAEWHLL